MHSPNKLVYHYPLFSFEESADFVDATTVQLVLDVEADYQPNVCVTHSPHPENAPSLDDYVRAQAEDMLQQSPMQDLRVLDKRDLLVDTEPAKELWLSYSLNLPNSDTGLDIALAMRSSQVFVIKHGVCLVLTFTARADDFDTLHGSFSRLVESLRFRA